MLSTMIIKVTKVLLSTLIIMTASGLKKHNKWEKLQNFCFSQDTFVHDYILRKALKGAINNSSKILLNSKPKDLALNGAYPVSYIYDCLVVA